MLAYFKFTRCFFAQMTDRFVSKTREVAFTEPFISACLLPRGRAGAGVNQPRLQLCSWELWAGQAAGFVPPTMGNCWLWAWRQGTRSAEASLRAGSSAVLPRAELWAGIMGSCSTSGSLPTPGKYTRSSQLHRWPSWGAHLAVGSALGCCVCVRTHRHRMLCPSVCLSSQPCRSRHVPAPCHCCASASCAPFSSSVTAQPRWRCLHNARVSRVLFSFQSLVASPNHVTQSLDPEVSSLKRHES